MTTVINNPGGNGEGGGSGIVIGTIIAIVLIALFFVYGLPALRSQPAEDGASINVTLPSGDDDSSSGN